PAPFQPMIQQLIDSTTFSAQNNLAQVSTQISVQSLKSLQNLDPSMFMGAGAGGNFGGPRNNPGGNPLPGPRRPGG
ncbi:MAG TPA: hypothetical protein VGY77_08400, partial [Gemmataceae bacterium]|nr:hypothetical protein [Gemmataceae bacterium]